MWLYRSEKMFSQNLVPVDARNVYIYGEMCNPTGDENRHYNSQICEESIKQMIIFCQWGGITFGE